MFQEEGKPNAKVLDFRNEFCMIEKKRKIMRERIETSVSKEIGMVHLGSPSIRSLDFTLTVVDRHQRISNGRVRCMV